jgi:SAM-dependent methyltransferase
MEKSEYLRMYNLETNYWWYKILHELVDFAIGKYKKEEEIKILDAGCGTGRMMEILQKHGLVYGIDDSEDAVYYAKKRGLNNVLIGDLNDYFFEKESYHTIICLDVLYHRDIKDDLAVAGNLYSALKTGGILIINLPAFEYLKRAHDKVVHTNKRYRKRTFVNDLKDIGFSIISSSYRLPHLYFIILISKLFMGNRNSKESESDLKELPDWLNRLLLFFGRIENSLLKRGFCFPVGSSLFVVAKK